MCLGTGCSSISGLFVQDRLLLAPMESADPRLIPPVGCFPLRAGPGLAGRGLTCLPSHLVVALRNLRRPPPPIRGSRSCAAQHQADWTAKFGSPGHGPARPDRAAVLFASATAATFGGRRLASWSCQVDGVLAWVSAERAPWISDFEMPSMRTFPPVPLWRGTSPSHAANSRPDRNADGSPIAATAAVALSTPRDRRNPPARLAAPVPHRQSPLDRPDLRIQLRHACPLLSQRLDHQGRQLLRDPGKRRGHVPPHSRAAARHHLAVLGQQAPQAVDLRRAELHELLPHPMQRQHLYGRLPLGKARFGVPGNRLQLYIRPVRAGSTPAGPDGISRPAPHSSCRVFPLEGRSRLGGSRSDLFAITPCRCLAQPSAATSSDSWFTLLRCPTSGGLDSKVRIVLPVMGQQGPDRARCLYGRLPLGKARFGVPGNRLQLYIRPVRAGSTPAGPDGISRPAPHSSCRVFPLEGRSRLGGSRSDLFAITPCRCLAQPSAATSSDSWFTLLRCPTSGGLDSKVRIVLPVMGQQGPDRARCLVRQRHGRHIRRTTSGQLELPGRRGLGVGERRAGAVDQQSAQVPVYMDASR